MLIIFYKVHQDINYKKITPMENSDTDWKKKLLSLLARKCPKYLYLIYGITF